MDILKRLLHNIAANPFVYDLIQILVGSRIVQQRLAMQIRQIPLPDLIVDMGGGTSIYRALWPQSTHYLCCDLDRLKLKGFRVKHPSDIPVLADVTHAPLKSSQADIVLCTSVSHHLSAEMWNQLLCESSRILKSGGSFILMDPIWVPQRWMSNLLWGLDRGSFPRSEEALRLALSGQFDVVHWDCFTIFHEYVIGVAVKRVQK